MKTGVEGVEDDDEEEEGEVGVGGVNGIDGREGVEFDESLEVSLLSEVLEELLDEESLLVRTPCACMTISVETLDIPLKRRAESLLAMWR